MTLEETVQSHLKENHAMTSVQRIDPSSGFDAQLAAASPDLLREMLSSFVHAVMNAEADTMCGAGYGERSEQRVNSCNGYRHRDFDTRVGTIDAERAVRFWFC